MKKKSVEDGQQKKSKRKKQESRQARPKHFRRNQQKLPVRDRALLRLRPHRFQKTDIRMALIREVEQDLAEQLPCRLQLLTGKLQQLI